MKVFFNLPEYDGQLLRALTYTSAGGADLGECLTTAARIKEGDFESWYNEWTLTADRVSLEGDHSLKDGCFLSASQCYFRASNYYRTAFFFLAGKPVDPRVLQAYHKHKDSFDKGIEHSSYHAEKVFIPYQGTFLPGYFYKPQQDGLQRPTAITFPGYDGTHQECFFAVAKGGLDRGFNVLCFDGPGQGDLLINQQIYMTPRWDLVLSPAIDFLIRRSDVAPESIAVIATSWGGMLAPLAASRESRICAMVLSPGHYEALLDIKKALPQLEELLQEETHAVLDKVLNQILADKMLAAKFKYKMWVHGVETAGELLKEWRLYSLESQAAEIKTPTLLVDNENDPFGVGQSQLLFNALQCPKEYILCKNAEGAGEHCGAGALTLMNQRIYNWLEITLRAAQNLSIGVS